MNTEFTVTFDCDRDCNSGLNNQSTFKVNSRSICGTFLKSTRDFSQCQLNTTPTAIFSVVISVVRIQLNLFKVINKVTWPASVDVALACLLLTFIHMKRNNQLTNTFLGNTPIQYLLKTPENFGFSPVCRVYKMGVVAKNRLI